MDTRQAPKELPVNRYVPCPHCGKVETVEIVSGAEFSGVDEEEYYPHSDAFAAVCNVNKGGCGAMSGFAPTEQTAEIKWNTRFGA